MSKGTIVKAVFTPYDSRFINSGGTCRLDASQPWKIWVITGVAEHSYPELRGTLGKVHFVLDKDIPEHDSRKSLESWLSKIKSDAVSPLQYTLVTDAKFSLKLNIPSNLNELIQ